MFLFPSNGKAFLNLPRVTNVAGCDVVSIPFKREGVSERMKVEKILETEIGLFLFPSNGKAFLNLITFVNGRESGNVSIPFKREGVSEHVRKICVNRRSLP